MCDTAANCLQRCYTFRMTCAPESGQANPAPPLVLSLRRKDIDNTEAWGRWAQISQGPPGSNK
eukprot:4326934-Alexandrium_andersonii.AAC.1